MKLAIFNGSPRGKGSNTHVLMQRLTEGYQETPGNAVDFVFLRDEKDMAAAARAFTECDAAVLAFPLYTDATPAVVKEFIEALQPLCGRPGNPALGFVVISGFPEAIHAQAVKRYLEKLAARLGCRYLGTATRGNAEGIRVASEEQNRAVFAAFRQFGRDVAAGRAFDEAAAAQLAGPLRFPRFMGFVFNILKWSGVANRGWDGMLKDNGAYEKRFDRPYD